MITSQQRAWKALTAALVDTMPEDLAATMVGGTHTRRLSDNLLPGLSQAQVRAIRTQLAGGDGGELTPTATGKRKAHAPYSSSALAANAFGRWIGHEPELTLAGMGNFDRPLALEHKLQIAYGGGIANLDCVLQAPGLIVGVESKLTETLTPHKPVPWKAPYMAAGMAAMLAGGWREALESSLAAHWLPHYLGVEQLVKHALALTSHANGRSTHLVYLYWEPQNGNGIPEVVQHRAELAQLAAVVADAEPKLTAVSYHQLFDEWAERAIPDRLPRARP